MRCAKCGTESTTDGQFCIECGAAIVAPQEPANNHTPMADPGAQQTAAVPPLHKQSTSHPEKIPTIKNVHLGEILFLLSGILLIAAGLENLGWSTRGFGLQYLLLGIFAIVGGLYLVAVIVMPNMVGELSKASNKATVLIALTFLIWGFAAAFAVDVGANGGLLVAAALAAALGIMLRESMIQ